MTTRTILSTEGAFPTFHIYPDEEVLVKVKDLPKWDLTNIDAHTDAVDDDEGPLCACAWDLTLDAVSNGYRSFHVMEHRHLDPDERAEVARTLRQVRAQLFTKGV